VPVLARQNIFKGGISNLLQKNLCRLKVLWSGGINVKWQEFKARMQVGLEKFMRGRNGVDQFTLFILVASAAVLLFARIFGLHLLRLVYYAGVIWALYRTFSRSLFRRRRENQLFLEKNRAAGAWLKVQRRIFQERNTHRHFKCPNCKQRLRVPKGRGKITISCAKCGEKFSRKS